MFFIKHYWRAVHYTLEGPIFVNSWFFWPAPDGPLKCSPSVRSESEERSKAPTEIQVSSPYKTSKNWESLEVVIKKLKVGCFKGSLTQSLFFMAVPGDLHIWAL